MDRFLINFTFTRIKFFSMILFGLISYSDYAFNDNKNSTLNPSGDQSRTDASTKVHQILHKSASNDKKCKESNYCVKEIYVA